MIHRTSLLRFLIVVFFFSFFGSQSLAGKFEGKIVFQFKTDSNTVSQTFTYYMKHDWAKIVVESAQDTNILIRRYGTFAIFPEMESYLTIQNDPKLDNEEITMIYGKLSKTLNRTDVTEEIAGIACTKWVLTLEDGISEYWVTDKFAYFFFFQDPPGTYESIFIRAALEDDYFPLKVVNKKPDGSLIGILEAIEVTEMTLEDSFFEIPDGYKELSGKDIIE